jgi:hypothetical protein
LGQFTVFYSFYGELNINKNGKMGKNCGETIDIWERLSNFEKENLKGFVSTILKVPIKKYYRTNFNF